MTQQFKTLREKIRADGISRKAQHAIWVILLADAHKAGVLAGKECKPTPMNVIGNGQRWRVDDGVCGFAWVHIVQGQRKFINFLKAQKVGHSSYVGGWDISCGEFGQSMERKEAYCRAYANVLRDGGIRCYPQSRLD